VDISLFFSADGGNNFKKIVNNLIGDIGRDVTSGKNSIVWDVLNERDVFIEKNVVFKIIGINRYGLFIDARDGKKYKTIQIGNQVWLAENLNYASSGSYCYYNKESNCEKYGRLYTFKSAKNVCPSGWRYPNSNDWTQLFEYLKPNDDVQLAAKNEWVHSFNNNFKGSDYNTSGFSALPSGIYEAESGKFQSLGYSTNWWTPDSWDANDGWSVAFGKQNSMYNKNSGLSVRCIKD
jgi:uncharacterized protein (TIGR02145 family)